MFLFLYNQIVSFIFIFRHSYLMLTKLRRELRTFFGETHRVGHYFRPRWKSWVLLFIISAIYTGLGLLNPIIVKWLIDDVLVLGNTYMLNLIIMIFAEVALTVTFLDIASSWLFARLQQDMLFDVRNDLFRHIELLDMGFFHEKDTGDLLSRLTDDIDGVSEFVTGIFQTGIMNVLTLIFIFAISVTLNPLLTLLALAVVPVLVISQKHYGRLVRVGYKSIRVRSADFLGFLQEKLSTVSMTKVFGAELREQRRQELKAKRLVRLAMRLTMTSASAGAVASLLIFAALLAVLWLGGMDVINGALTIGGLVAIYTYITMMFGPVNSLTDLNLSLQGAIVKVNRVFTVLDRKPRIVEKKHAKQFKVLAGQIKFDHVNFGYEGSKPILKNVSFKIKPGEIVGLVGPSGSGKTTIAKLLVRLYDPDSGNISIDMQNLRGLKLDSLRSQLGLVKQDIIMLKGTVAENIAYGKPNASTDDIVKAAKLAGAHDFIMQLPRGYDTIVGPGAVELSGGQAQRISIARVILKDPKVLILDEPTSALDSKIEMYIEEALRQVMRGRTSVIITHRLHTMKSADRLIVMNNGRVAETGTFVELMAKRGLFYKMYTTEFGGFHTFASRFDYELRSTILYKRPTCLGGIRIKNLEDIERKIGKKSTAELLDQIESITAKFTKSPDLAVADPHHLDIVYVGLPGMSKAVAQRKLSSLARQIANKVLFKVSLSYGSVLAPEEGQTTDKLMQKVRGALTQ